MGERNVGLSDAQIDALLIAASFLVAGEWDEIINGTQKRSLDAAVNRLRAARTTQNNADKEGVK